jgi:hypothetical protein
MGKACSTNSEQRNGYGILARKPEGKRPLVRPRHVSGTIKKELGETGWDGMDWIGLAQDRDR